MSVTDNGDTHKKTLLLDFNQTDNTHHSLISQGNASDMQNTIEHKNLYIRGHSQISLKFETGAFY